MHLVWQGRRGRVDLRDTAVRTLYEWGDVVPRKVSAGLLNAISEGPSLALPDIPPGQPSSLLPGVQVGEVVRVKGAMQQSYFLLLPQGKQQVERAVADPIVCLTWQGPDQAPVITTGPGERLPLDDGDSPVEVPRGTRGQTADSVFLKPTKGALVRGVVPGQRPTPERSGW